MVKKINYLNIEVFLVLHLVQRYQLLWNFFDFDHVIDNDVLENEMLAISNATATTVSR